MAWEGNVGVQFMSCPGRRGFIRGHRFGAKSRMVHYDIEVDVGMRREKNDTQKETSIYP